MQSMIDILVLFPAMGLNKESSPAIQALIANMKEKAADFQAISKGNAIQINQAVRLFEAVCEYQGLASNRELAGKVAATNGLLKVRGPVLRNPVSATVYYNYLGLYYRKCAVSMLGEKDGVDVDSLRRWKGAGATLPPANTERLKRYLSLADDAFAKALSRSHDDPMWLGYILFNQARVAFIRAVAFELGGDSVASALGRMQDAIDARSTLNELIADVVGSNSSDSMSVLQQHYLYQEEYARQLYVNHCLVTDHVATYRGATVGSPEAYEAMVGDYVAPLSDGAQRFLATLRGA